MDDNYIILFHDLRILESMAADMAGYLDSDVTGWIIPRANMPKLTIGGYLMREHRLSALSGELNVVDKPRLTTAIQTFDTSLEERVVRFEKRAHEELHNRIGEWIAILRDLGSRLSMERNYFAGIVDTRVVINHLTEKLQQSPYQLADGVLQEITALDKNLRARTEIRPFIWDDVWQPAYPAETYWWLYCCPLGSEKSST